MEKENGVQDLKYSTQIGKIMDAKKILLYGFAATGALFMILLIATTIHTWTDSTVPIATQKTIQPAPAPLQTPEPQRASIIVKQSTEAVKSIGKYYTVGDGKVFLIYNLEIENHGYTKFNTNPFYWKARVDNIEYTPATVTFSEDVQRLETVDVLDGGKVRGQLVFEVPDADEIRSVLTYNGIGNYNIVPTKMD